MSKFLYLDKKSKWVGEWCVVCPACHKIIATEDWFPDEEEDYHCKKWLREWAVEEVHYHIKGCEKAKHYKGGIKNVKKRGRKAS